MEQVTPIYFDVYFEFLDVDFTNVVLYRPYLGKKTFSGPSNQVIGSPGNKGWLMSNLKSKYTGW